MEFLFVTQAAVMNKTQAGGGVRSTLLIKALSRIGHVDVISFAKEPVESSISNCDVIFSGETRERELTIGDRALGNLKLFFAPWRPEAYCPVNQEQVKIISRYYNAKHYDYVVCHFIWDARGFDCVFQANRHYWLANSDQEFVDQVLNVLSDRTKASLMAREACEIAKVKFSQESFFEVVKTSLSRLFQNTFFPNFDVIPKVVSPFRGNNNKTRNSWTCGEKA